MAVAGTAAHTDPLTGAYVRSLLGARVDAAAANGGCSLFLFDLDYFKSVNDTYGHQRGDEILTALAARVRAAVRDTDELYRYGGDEFVILLPDTERDEAVRLALTLVEAIRGDPFPGEPALRISVSLGVATSPADGGDLKSLLASADRRNYIAKARGRDCAVADDAEPDAAENRSRLLDREQPLAAVNEVLTRLGPDQVEYVSVSAPRGAGHTRFLEEVRRLATLRGFQTFDLASPDEVRAGPDDTLVVTVDVGAGPSVAAAVAQWAPQVRALAVIYAQTDDLGLPASAAAELTPLSRGSARILVRTLLAGEPGDALVRYLHDRTGGLPAALAREVARTRQQRLLIRGDDGGWTIRATDMTRRRRHDVPVPPTTLIGREADCDRIVRLLGTSRLVTLTGPGGVGKTRLSMAAAVKADLPDGSVFIPLADIDRADAVAEAVAAALGAVPGPGEPLLDAVVEHLGDAEILLVLDNLEQVLDAAEWIGALLDRTPAVRMIATSRERLSLYGEQVFQVASLGLPADGPTPPVELALRDFPALALFEGRAQAVDADFRVTADTLPTVIQICRRLDGLPLAIELAAAGLDRWSPHDLLRQLSDRLDALADGPRNLPSRQRTMRGAIDWSVDLLSVEQRTTFGRLAVFAGGAAAGSVAEVLAAGPEAVTTLVNKNLVVHNDSRYAMLETIRVAALELLAEDESADLVWARHAQCFARLAHEATDALIGPEAPAWGRRLESEFANLRVAFETSMRRADIATAVVLCRGLWRWWCDGHHLDEGREWCDRVLRRAGGEPDISYIAAALAHVRDDHARAQELAEQSLTAYRAAGDAAGVAKSLSALGMAAFSRGDYAAARAHHTRSLAAFEELGDQRGLLVCLTNLARTALRLDDVDAADGFARRHLSLSAGAGARDQLLSLEDQAEVAIRRRDTATARSLLARTTALSRELNDPAGEALADHQRSRVEYLDGEHAEARRLSLRALELRREHKLYEDLAISLETFASMCTDVGAAAELLGAAAAVRDRYALSTPPHLDGLREAVRSRGIASLGEREFHRSSVAGRRMPLDLVIERARDLL